MIALKSALKAVWSKIQTEPVVVIEASTSVIAAGVGLGLYSADKSAAIAVAVGAVIKLAGTVFARSKVTPV